MENNNNIEMEMIKIRNPTKELMELSGFFFLVMDANHTWKCPPVHDFGGEKC